MKVTGRTYAAIFLISLAALMVEVALTRFFSFTIWYHFAYMTISVALLGYGAAGSVYYAFPELTRSGVSRSLSLASIVGGLTLIVCLVIVSALPFEPFRLFSGPGFPVLGQPLQLLYLTGIYLAVTAPFFAAGLCITTVFRNAPESIPSLYFSDLLGAAVGSILGVVLLGPLGAPGIVFLGASLLFAAGLLFSTDHRRLAMVCAAGFSITLVLAGAAGNGVDVRVSVAKFFARLRAGGATVLFSRWNPVYRVDVLAKADGGSFRMGKTAAWGVSERYPGPVPENLVITHDGDASTMLYRLDGNLEPLKILDWSVLALPYLFHSKPNVLVIGTGGGVDIIQAVRKGASHVTGVELNPVTVRLLLHDFKDYTGGFFLRPEVSLVVDEGRSFVRRGRDRYDVIQLTGVDTLAAVYSGAYVLSESYLYTTEAIQDYIARLSERGILSFVRGDAGFGGLPPRQIFRLLVTMAEALERLGVAAPREHLMVVRSKPPNARFSTFSILLRRTAFSEKEVKRMEEHCALTGFEPWHLPGQRLKSPASELLWMDRCDREKFLAQHPLNVTAVVDDRPFFFNFLHWQDLLDPQKLRHDYTFAAGQLVLLMILIQSLFFGSLFIIGPLFRYGIGELTVEKASYLAYFAALGLGFMLLEISYIQRFTLFLGSPVFALAVVLAGLLVFSGIGSFLTGQLPLFENPRKILPLVAAALVVVTLGYSVALTFVFTAALGLPLVGRAAIALALLAPLGLLMGTFLPLGMKVLRQNAEAMIPWGWAANGVASVVGSVLAILLAMSFGFRMVGYLALGIYVLGVAAMRSALATRNAT